MKGPLRIAALVVGGLVALVLLVIGYVVVALPKAFAVPSIKVTPTPESTERGAYLTEHVAVCISCHSTRDYTHFAGPVVPGSEGRGGERFDREHGLPGNIVSSNITPAALSGWSDGEIARAITTGVNKGGKALFPVMPYPGLSHLCNSDLEAVLVSVRGLKPVQSSIPATELDFPVSVLVRTMPAPADPWPCPNGADEVALGKYLTEIASCASCHTPIDKGKPLPGKELAGGFEFKMTEGSLARSANITPDKATGIGNWTKEQFVQRFKALANAAPPEVKPGAPNTPMPWYAYAGMTERDLGAIYAFLRTVKPVDNKVEHFGKW
jgi:mono/diheme cytochrome c family protein